MNMIYLMSLHLLRLSLTSGTVFVDLVLASLLLFLLGLFEVHFKLFFGLVYKLN